jgi:hypothetical protein
MPAIGPTKKLGHRNAAVLGRGGHNRGRSEELADPFGQTVAPAGVSREEADRVTPSVVDRDDSRVLPLGGKVRRDQANRGSDGKKDDEATAAPEQRTHGTRQRSGNRDRVWTCVGQISGDHVALGAWPDLTKPRRQAGTIAAGGHQRQRLR